MGISYQTSSFNRQSQQPFAGIRFFLYGFDPETRDRASRRLVFAGACSPDCTHDDPVCVTARRDGKILVSEMWLMHSFEVGGPVLTDLLMVQLMGAKFTRPLRADTVTHLVCYKFE
ncbi:BRCT domain-containing protein, partial [Tanacetum coccineum]